MRKYTFLISILILSIILAFPGCGGSNKSGGNGGIKIYESMGGVAYMPKNLSGIAFADSITEIGNEYIYFVGNNSESVIPTITAYCKDGEGNIIDAPVVFAVEGDNCFSMENPQNLLNGGSAFQLIGIAPGGKAKLTATANGQTREVDVYIYDSYGHLGGNSGRIINFDGSHDNSTTKSECTFFEEVDGIKLVGKSYFIESCNGSDWKDKLRAVKTVDTAQLAVGNIDNEFGISPNIGIYVAEVPGGGYVKITHIGVSTIWEYSQTTSFK